MNRRRSFEGARCLVTGASSGLGQAIAEHLVRAGASVVLTGRSLNRLEATARALVSGGARDDAVIAVDADLTEDEGRSKVIHVAADRFGALDLVVNAASVSATGHFDTHDPSVLRRVFEINVFALIELTRAVLPLLRQGDRPSLVNLGSILARRAMPGRSEYSASKFAVAGFTESIRAEWSRFGIHVLLLNPGVASTEFENNLVADPSRISAQRQPAMTPDQVARQASPGCHPPGASRSHTHPRRPTAPPRQPSGPAPCRPSNRPLHTPGLPGRHARLKPPSRAQHPTNRPIVPTALPAYNAEIPKPGRLAQLVERLLYTQDAGGSSPSSPIASCLSVRKTFGPRPAKE